MELLKRLWKDKKYVYILWGILMVVSAFLMGKYGYNWIKIIRYLCLESFLLLIAFIDYKEMRIPNRILLWMLVIRGILLLMEIITFPKYWKELLLSAGSGMLIGLIIFLLAYFLSRKSIGLGDVKLAAVLGWYLGAALIWWDIVVSLGLSAIYSIIQLIRKKVGMKDAIPLAPFFSIGTIIIIILGF